jgi:type I restriction enzyme M protein
VFDRLAFIETELAPYECVKAQLAEARARYRELTDAFVDELKARCAIMNEDEKRALVLELLAQDVQAGLDSAVSEKSQECIDFLANLWDKYRVPLTQVSKCRGSAQAVLDGMLREIGYA